jgi:hypothetical protein
MATQIDVMDVMERPMSPHDVRHDRDPSRFQEPGTAFAIMLSPARRGPT